MADPLVPPNASAPGRDPRAERRLAYAQAAMADGAWQEAAEMFEQAIDLAPDWTAAWVALGDARRGGGDLSGAMATYRQALALDPADTNGAALRLAALDQTALPMAAPQAYVTALFDAYAERFETHLTQGLGYRGPAHLIEALAEAGFARFGHAIDLGCGTGLGGLALRPSAVRLTGVDLSPKILAEAEAKRIYDRLVRGDILTFLQAEPPDSADLVMAADVFVYVGDLAPVLRAAARALRRGGALAFTAQHGDNGVGVGADMRFTHAPAYIEAVLNETGFAPVSVRKKPTRREKGRDVAGLVVVATRR